MFLEDLFTTSQPFTNHCRVVDCEELDDAFEMEFFSLKQEESLALQKAMTTFLLQDKM